jgi:hypothetical protein
VETRRRGGAHLANAPSFLYSRLNKCVAAACDFAWTCALLRRSGDVAVRSFGFRAAFKERSSSPGIAPIYLRHLARRSGDLSICKWPELSTHFCPEGPGAQTSLLGYRQIEQGRATARRHQQIGRREAFPISLEAERRPPLLVGGSCRRHDGFLAGAPAWKGRHGAEVRERCICVATSAEREGDTRGRRAEGAPRRSKRGGPPLAYTSWSLRWRGGCTISPAKPHQEGVAET